MGLVGLAIIAAAIGYTSYLASRLSKIEENNARFFAIALEDQNDIDSETEDFCDLTLQTEITGSNTTIPTLIVNKNGVVDFAMNLPELDDYFINDGSVADSLYVNDYLAGLIADGREPMPSAFGTMVYFGESHILQQLKRFPYYIIGLTIGFILLGYLGVNAARKAEQNRVWVGMAKETAHQLGTPISAIIGWMEHLKVIREGDEEIAGVIGELTKDVNRLELIAHRFSKIGSEPKLEAVDVYTELDRCRAYMEKRAPRRVEFDFPPASVPTPLYTKINPPLFDWVVENLLRNALDALEGRGQIKARVYAEGARVAIDISDTGKGIPAGKFKTVFQPGYTTKKRGWGLGLSLAKRIIEEYHGGKIFVKRSEEGQGTTFTILLPRAERPADTTSEPETAALAE